VVELAVGTIAAVTAAVCRARISVISSSQLGRAGSAERTTCRAESVSNWRSSTAVGGRPCLRHAPAVEEVEVGLDLALLARAREDQFEPRRRILEQLPGAVEGLDVRQHRAV